MDQIPATPAKVSYQGGLLTISAQNSTLGEILRDVRKLTGASIEIPPGSGTGERVVAHLGPAAPRDVLAGLLNGSSFNYVMLGSSSDPTAVSSVILTPKPSAAGETQTAANLNPNNPGAMPPNRFPPSRSTGQVSSRNLEMDNRRMPKPTIATKTMTRIMPTKTPTIRPSPQPGQPDVGEMPRTRSSNPTPTNPTPGRRPLSRFWRCSADSSRPAPSLLTRSRPLHSRRLLSSRQGRAKSGPAAAKRRNRIARYGSAE